jgi:two-component system, NtrC family, sensor kinase
MNLLAQPVNHRILVVDDNESIHADFKKILTVSKDRKKEKSLQKLEDEIFGLLNPEVGESKKTKTSFEEEFAEEDLAETHYEINYAQQGHLALKLVEESLATNAHYSLAFVDMRMPPGWDGLETIQRIWAIAPEIEIVICTAFADHSLDEIQTRLGRTDRLLFLRKPFDVVSVQQIAAAMTRKNELFRENQLYVQRLESQVREKVQELEQERALSWNRVKMGYLGNMAGAVAHEIKNPLTIIQGHSDRILGMIRQKQFGSDEMLVSISKIGASTNRIVNVIDSMMNLAQYEENRKDVCCDLVQATQMSINLCSEWAKSFSIDLRVYFPQTLSPAKCAAAEVQQMVTNLLNNAIDATLEVTDRWIEVRVFEKDECVFVSVTNSGPKIVNTIVNKIFDPFFTTKNLGQGIGLGLSVLKSLAESRNGKVTLMQDPNTCFLIEMPVFLEPMAK